MQFLRSNTAVLVTVGPFYDKTDGVTIETGLTITNERITLTADTDAGSAPTNILDNVTGATSGTANDLNYITGNDAGMMQLELAAADVNRVGRMTLSITDAANHVPVFHEYFVLPQAIFDWLTGVIVPLPANVTTWLGTAAATPTVAGVPEVDVTHFGGSAGSFASGVPAVNADQISGDSTAAANLENAYDDTAGQVSWAGIVDQGTAQSVGANDIVLRSAAAFVDDALIGCTVVITNGTQVGSRSIITDYVGATDTATLGNGWTGATPTGTPTYKIFGSAAGSGVAQTGDAYARLGAPAGASVSADIAAVKSDSAAILVDTGTTLDGRIPAALVSGRMDASVGAMAANTFTASALASDAVDEFWDDTIGDGSLTARQALRVLIAALAGKLSGAATTTITIRNAADSANVIVATVDADGNRSAVTVTP